MRNLMSLLGGLAAAMTVASPAAAESWTTKDDAGVDYYSAGVQSEDGRKLLVVSCESGKSGLPVMIFTGERYDPGTSDPAEVNIGVAVDGHSIFFTLGSFEKDPSGQLAVLFDGYNRLFDDLAASKSTIKVQVGQQEYGFSAKGSTVAMRHLHEKCK
jgi:hypothetical protein